jgi:hypothetical protein
MQCGYIAIFMSEKLIVARISVYKLSQEYFLLRVEGMQWSVDV